MNNRGNRGHTTSKGTTRHPYEPNEGSGRGTYRQSNMKPSLKMAAQDQGHQPRKPTKNRPCKFGTRCTRKDCWFQHPPRNAAAASTASTPSNFTIPNPKTTKSSNTKIEPKSGLEYRFCTLQECHERQELHQVSSWESTRQTSGLPQVQRVLDPQLAVAKYRRSAAGRDESRNDQTHWDRTKLLSLLDHLIHHVACRSSPDMESCSNESNSIVCPNQEWLEFLVDRLRAAQADGTRLLGTLEDLESSLWMPSEWHLKYLRLVLWIQYWMPYVILCATTPTSANKDEPSVKRQAKAERTYYERTIHSLATTAISHFWTTREAERRMETEDSITQATRSNEDEILSYSVLLKVVEASQFHQTSTAVESADEEASVIHGLLSPILLEYQRYKSRTNGNDSYPRLQRALEDFALPLLRLEYYSLLHPRKRRSTCSDSELTPSANMILAPCLRIWRYRLCQALNVSYVKQEAVLDLHRLLHVDERIWSTRWVEVHLNLPILELDSSSDNLSKHNFKVVLKQAPMARDPPPLEDLMDLQSTDRESFLEVSWVFETSRTIHSWKASQPMGLGPTTISSLLQSPGRSVA